uniref:Uncharacterized protein n=1 Tax=Tetradesmus obliquus TaxID=3088 RepID=A0A383V4I4_TETOB|eukprot:jgi/Sobl393_1/15362/SZX60515.1
MCHPSSSSNHSSSSSNSHGKFHIKPRDSPSHCSSCSAGQMLQPLLQQQQQQQQPQQDDIFSDQHLPQPPVLSLQQQPLAPPLLRQQQQQRRQQQQQQQQQLAYSKCNCSHQRHSTQHRGQQHLQRPQQLRRQPAGSTVLHLLLVMLPSFLQAAAAAAAVPAVHDVLLPLPPGVYNPSLVVYEGSAWLVARSTKLKWDDTGMKWIMNRAHLCQLHTTNWSVVRCSDFDPWRGNYGQQCRWGSASWKVPWEAWGVDDTKLLRWPGRGLWALTGRRPQKPEDSIYCPQPVVWKQWLVQLAEEGQPLNPEPLNHPAADPPGVTWSEKPKSSSSSSSSSSSGRPRRLTQVPPAAAPAATVSSSSSSSAAGGLYRRHRTAVRRRYKQHTRPAFSSTTNAGQQSAGLVLPTATAAAAAPLPAGLPPVQKSSSSSSSSGDDGGWRALWGQPPLPLAIADAKAVYGQQHSVNEKNWMPFVWQGQLLVTYALTPKHRVYRLRPNGLAEPAWESDPSAVFAPLGAAAAKLHGGPPLVLVNFTQRSDSSAAATSRQAEPYYLGVAHYWLPTGANKEGRLYRHFLIKVEAQPPFQITQLSAELPVRYSAHYKRVAFVSGLELATLPSRQQQQGLATQQQQQQQGLAPHVLISYGSGDWESHLALLSLADVDALFAAAAAAAAAAAPGGRLV